ncbi:MAG: hypothetical protein EZS28_018161 [Streblomastix strix]|uniref:Uncharacterized protein n=1 Tax=Streblomastix strix TaxID=222440 RepID=A0A5J4VUG7_9EUKA|nr:MAG: hypothetical protein EZS28_018161 [Streblomastix strix]
MQESSNNPDKHAESGTQSSIDVATIIPRLIQDLQSDNTNLHVPALRQLLGIVIDDLESKDLVLKYELKPILNKFAGNVEKNEKFVLSTTILHVIEVRNGSDDKIILAGAATESIILTIFSPDDKISKSGSKALEKLISENEIIRNSLMTTGFIQTVHYVFTHKQQSSSPQTESTTPYHVKCGLLDIVYKLVTTSDDLKPTSILIQILNELKINGEKEVKKKSMNILAILKSQGINEPSSEPSKEKDEKIHQLEESIRLKDEKNKALKAQNAKLKKEIEKIKLEYPQVVPHEYNIINGLPGVGQDILLEILSEMKHIQDRIQYVGVCKKTLQLKNLQRFVQIVQKFIEQGFPIAIHNPDPTDIDLIDIDDVQKKITKKQTKYNTVSLTQILEEGIWSLETVFNSANDGFYSIGIVQDSFNIPAGQSFSLAQFASFTGKPWGGNIYCRQRAEAGNAAIGNNQIVKIEYDSEKGTLVLFIDEVQQPVYISGIKEKIRFIVFLYDAGAVCTVRSLKQLSEPTSKHLPNERAAQW